MLNIPYIKINQRGETFFVVKIKAIDLKKNANFHFRDPYWKYKNKIEIEKSEDYLKRIRNKGIDLKSSPEGIQRRLQETRIFDIKNFIENNETNFLPNSIILSMNVDQDDDFMNKYLTYESNEFGTLELPENVVFNVIDGQHRLAGLFQCENELISKFDLIVVLLINVSVSTAAKLFTDINGKQKTVNRSLIYDISEEIDLKETSEIKKYHSIAKTFYTDKKSPLCRQIKMLGVGSGAISQAFFIDYVQEAIEKTDLKNGEAQIIYDHLFYYFNSFQFAFPDDWPVQLNVNKEKDLTDEEIDSHSNEVLKVRKSQLCKTNGFGAIMILFPDVHLKSNKNYSNYLNIISNLKGKITWFDKDGAMGTGKKFQTELVKKMRNILFDQEKTQ